MAKRRKIGLNYNPCTTWGYIDKEDARRICKEEGVVLKHSVKLDRRRGDRMLHSVTPFRYIGYFYPKRRYKKKIN